MEQRKSYDLLVLGAGESGVGAALLAQAKGISVFVSDYGKIAEKYRQVLVSRHIDFEEGQHSMDLVLSVKEVVCSPGIPDTAPVMKALKDKGIPIVSEIEFAARYSKAKMIAITGSNGKTTTTMWIYHTLQKAGLDVGLAGNVGFSLAAQLADRDRDYFVIELSSFQLDRVYDFHAHVAVVLNISPDHLDRYNNSLDLYAEAKMRITNNQTERDYLIYWAEDKWIANWIEKNKPKAQLLSFAALKPQKHPAAWINYFKELTTDHECNGSLFLEEGLLALPGKHNLLNAMATALAAKAININNKTICKSLEDFKAVEHRLEKIATIDGVDYINDSKATNVDATWYALDSIKNKVLLILGGTDKGNDYTQIEELVLSKARALIFMGVDNSKLHSFFDTKVDTIVDARSMHEAISHAQRLAQRGDTVLLSPACASFDLFKNYEDRGDQFREEVLRLATNTEN